MHGRLMAFALGAGLLAGLSPARAQTTDKMNVVFILADDLGWSDTTLFGTTRFYETPNIARLARRGMLFRRAYAANPLCSPTRASILTGLDPARLGFTTPGGHLPEERLEAALVARADASRKALTPRSVTRLSTNLVTLAEVLRQAGYVTGHFGKWHLGPEPYSPLQHGFDVDVPHWWGPGPAGSYVAPWKFPAKLHFTGQPGEHLEDRMAEEAIRFLRRHRNRPFFLNYWAFSVHAPFDAKPSLIEHYRAKADPADEQRCPVYGAMVHSLDEAVGRLLDTLDELDLSRRTIVVFFSDNGGNTYDRIDGLPPTSNRPLRGGKATLYEGGTRVPCAVVWPGRIRPGSVTDAPLSSVDFFPTLLDMLGLPAPAGVAFDGVSQTPALLGRGTPRDTVFSFFPHYTPATGNRPGVWVIRDDWKLIRFFCDGPHQEDRFELYHLSEDIGETRNLAAEEPERVRTLNRLIDDYLKRTGALIPRPNPAYNPSLADWSTSKDTELHRNRDSLRIRSTGRDPWLATDLKPPVQGPFEVELRLRSTARGAGQCFWSENGRPFSRQFSVTFEPRHDGQWHDYRITLPAGRATRLRLDPATAPGEIHLQRLLLRDAKGKVLREWNFTK